jgi:hypothetical protein
MRVLPRHDVFIVYSQAEPEPFQLVRTVYDDLVEVGFTLPGYEEMDWFIDAPERKVNTPMLEAYFKGAKCVIVMARQMTSGVAVELETLAKDPAAPPVLAVAWGDTGPGHEAFAPFTTLRIARWRDADASDHARRLRGWVWLAVVLNDLLPLGAVGHWVIGDLIEGSREAAAIVAGCRRFPPALREAAQIPGASGRDPRAGAVQLPETVTIAAALGVWRYWNGGAATIAGHVTRHLPKPLSSALDAVRLRLDAICAALERRFPRAMVLDVKSRATEAEARFRIDAGVRSGDGDDAPDTDSSAEGDEQFKLCMMRALEHANSPATAELALRDFAGALQAVNDAGLALPFRHNALIRRAELLINMDRLDAALADLDEIVAAGATADEYARFSAHYLRGGARYRLRQWAGAIADYGAVMADRRAPDTTRLSARLRRGAAHVQAGDVAAARLDYQAVLADTRASESTRKTAQHNLDDLAGRT